MEFDSSLSADRLEEGSITIGVRLVDPGVTWAAERIEVAVLPADVDIDAFLGQTRADLEAAGAVRSWAEQDVTEPTLLTFAFDGTDERGERLPAGDYAVTLRISFMTEDLGRCPGTADQDGRYAGMVRQTVTGEIGAVRLG